MTNTIYIPTNNYQTPVDDELRKSLPKDVWVDLLEYIESVKFIQNLIAIGPERGVASSLPRWDNPNEDWEEDRVPNPEGRIRVNLVKPHILEDMDFFRERSLYFQQHGVYTKLRPNPNPRSEYSKFWKEEQRRWRDGLVRESDGEWIPGRYYFYLNYSPIWINEEIEDTGVKKKKKKGRVKGIRKKEFPKPWLGDYLWFHYMEKARDNGAHCKLLKKRGCGFSFKFGAITPHAMYTEKGLPNFHLASDKGFLLGDKGVFSKVINTLDWVGEKTPFAKLRLVDGKEEKKLGYKEGVKECGIMSSVFAISLKDNPDKARGIRGPIIQYEEDGMFPDITDAWLVNLEATEEGGIVFGMMIAGGTGGTLGANFEGSEKMFYNPEPFHIYGLKNVFDKNTSGELECGFFWGAYLNRSRCYDESVGEPDVIKALVEVLIDRYGVKNSSPDPALITRRKAEQPITPSEAVMRVEGTLFPIADLKNYMDTIRVVGPKFHAGHYIGNLITDVGGNIEWKPDGDVHPIKRYPLSTQEDVQGGIEIFELPKKDKNGRVFKHRYIAGIDPVDDDHSTTNSLTSIIIFDLLTDRIVAEYTGRPNFASDFYETCRRLLLFYNAVANYEADKKGLFAYFDQRNCLHLLCDNPQILKDMEYAKGGNYGNKAKGTQSGKRINEWGRRLQVEWMRSSAYTQEYDEDGNQVGERINMHTIRSTAYIDECIAWNIDGNFDRVSAMGMLMIYREDRAKYNYNQQNETKVDEDAYFTENFKNAFPEGYQEYSYGEIQPNYEL